MKKSTLVAMILGVIGGTLFAIGMCACLIPELGSFNQGVVAGVAGAIVLLADYLIWRRMTGKAPIQVTPRAVGTVLLGIVGALVFGVGMALSMVFGHMVMGIVVGVIGIVILLVVVVLARGIEPEASAQTSR